MTQWSKEGFRYRLDKFPAGSAPEQVVFSIQSDQVTAISSSRVIPLEWHHIEGLGDDLTIISLSLIIQYCP